MRGGLSFRAAGRTLLAVLVGTVSGCIDGDPTGLVGVTSLGAVIHSGDRQFGRPETTLDRPLEVLVHRLDGQELEEAVRVTWEIVEGHGASLSRTSGFTDGAQRARTELTLGTGLTRYRVRASFPEVDLAPLEFSARAVVPPTLVGVSPDPVAPGEPVVLEGSGFVPELEEIDVFFSGIRARVLEGSEDGTSLTVRVPACLNEEGVEVRVGLGALRSEPRSVGVNGVGTATHLDPSDVLTVDDPSALQCLLLDGSPDRRFLAVIHSTSDVGVASHDFSLVLRHGGGGVLADGGRGSAAPSSATAPPSSGPPPLPTPSYPPPSSSPSSFDTLSPIGTLGGQPGEAQDRWDRFVRNLEADAVEDRESRERESAEGGAGDAPAAAAVRAPPGVPELYDRRDFNVLNGNGGFEQVTAEVRYVSQHSVIYVDREAPPGGFESSDLAGLGDEFDTPIYETVRGAFGTESDLDENERIVILFTPEVNRLTEAGSDGFVGGFFYGVDLLPDRAGSNAAEIFYALVPDPDGEFGEPRTRLQVLSSVPAVLAHEFQHMIHFNERVLVRRADRADAVWLSEALASTAEDLVARAYTRSGRPGRAQLFNNGNFARARNFLADPWVTSLVSTRGSGSLEERGAGWLFLKHVRGENLDPSLDEWILEALTQTTRTGTENVTEVLAQSWEELVQPWTVALYLDGLGLDVDPKYTFRWIDLRGELAGDGEDYPLQPTVHGDRDHTVRGQVRSSSAYYALLEPTGENGLAVNLAGSDRGALPPGAGLALTLVRIR